MDFSLSEEQQIFRRNVRNFLDENLRPRAQEIDSEGRIPTEVLRGLADMGLLAMMSSEEYGGSQSDALTSVIAAEEIGRADLSMATAVFFLVECGWGYILDEYGREGLKSHVLPRVTDGEWFLGIASTEPGGGSDVLSMKSTVEKSEGKLTVNGEKTYISGVREAEEMGGGFVTLLKSDPEAEHRGFSLVYVPVRETDGVTVEVQEMMGREGISNGTIYMSDVRLPNGYLIGKWNRGFYHLMEGFNVARTLVSAACLGASREALERGMTYIKEREAFGQPIGKYEGVQFPLADLYARLEGAKSLIYRTAWMIDNAEQEGFGGRDIAKYVASCKLLSVPLAYETFTEVCSWFGAYGYTEEAGLEAGLRGVSSYLFGAEGAQNIMRIIVGRELLGGEYVPYR